MLYAEVPIGMREHDRMTAISQSIDPVKPIYLVDDDPIFRRMIHSELTSLGMTVWCFNSGQDFLEHAATAQPGPIILDLRMPQMDGLELLKALRTEGINWPVLMSSAFADLRVAVTAMQLGAVDFLEKPISIEALKNSVESALIDAIKKGDKYERIRSAQASFSKLTEREMEIAHSISRGLPNKGIARDLDISPRTVEAHRSSIFSKLKISSSAELVRMLTDSGMLS